ncbi:MAG: UDP-N-acetylmuramoylalanine--D-glutamate ligase [Candidatus Berkelbacteria bacterium Licking1014_7]|uniref:UDP-N-acetylmuramoylalanine--D-glutamate ligase n=1 Tax=Candidatus Berkelbacteria bacterium Licking1014_7 TaxID=2017147 RepID=A0A554LJJ3_9BACT|nr:MAG: UDP-N-acetylmuramoylalanine--D-glutamate ligase [Candidatus Berkelbacteria bacterium Licking1014_7]
MKFRLGEEYLDNLDNFDLVIRTPGIPYLNQKIQQARNQGAIITSQTKLFFDLCPAKIIGITGTKGKGTTASLIFRILMKKFIGISVNVYLAGNFGVDPFEFLDELKKDDEIVYEMSSFQLQDMGRSPHIAVVLNITDDHLDYHQDAREYIQAKYQIVAHQKPGDVAVINADYIKSFAFAGITQADIWWFSLQKEVETGAFLQNGKVKLAYNGAKEEICKVSDLRLRGRHNLENILASILVGRILGSRINQIARAVKTFDPLEHRLEPVLERKGIVGVNDSYATNPEATISALDAFPHPILICGGKSKGLKFSRLGKAIAKKAKRAILLGENQREIFEAIPYAHRRKAVLVDDLEQAVDKAVEIAKKGDTILFSPASASFDQFSNASERGQKFKELIIKYL